MKNTELSKYYVDNNIPPYHGIAYIDALKYLSEMDAPAIMKADYTQQYEKAIYGLEICTNYKLGDLLYNRFNDNVINVSKDIISEFAYQDITICSMEVEIPYFAKMNEYLSLRLSSKFNVFDIRIGELSLLNEVINKPISKSRYQIEKFFNVNDIHWILIKYFKSPYNGISSNMIPEIAKDCIAVSRYGSPVSNLKSYLLRLLDANINSNITEKFIQQIQLLK